MFAGQSEGHGLTEVDREGIVLMSGDQDSLAPFVHRPHLGDGYGLVELSVHAGTVGHADCYWEVNGGSQGSIFLVFRLWCAQELPLVPRSLTPT